MKLAAQQNFDLTGGTFFIDTGWVTFAIMAIQEQSQFNGVPIRIGYRQDLLGYNRFKWEKENRTP